MYTTETAIRVRYAETDRMGFCYYGNYAQFFEVARVEALRSLGISYKTLEDKGVLLPVVSYHVEYKNPAYYDDELIIKCNVRELPGVRIIFDYQTYREDELLNEASTTLVFVKSSDNKPMRIPEELLTKFSPYYN
ncbi:MAG: acyl-CoA thioesterase [Flavobacteriales bacterium]|nr:acyl-CoA thioesterase [Flavobacteriales bacterium]